MKRIGFIGLGLIGGSIAKAIKANYPDYEIFAHPSRIETIREAFEAGIINNDDFLDLSEYAKMDYVFLCAPVQKNIEYLNELAPVLQKNCIITDVGSVKGEISKEAEKLGIQSQFIGGHPMTGSEKTGFKNGSTELLENAFYILIDNPEINPKAFEEFASFIKSLGSMVITSSADKHDRSVAAISHLPHIISASLVNLVSANDSEDGMMKRIAAGGFRDITRISSSSPVMWENICVENRDEILSMIDIYQEELLKIRQYVDDSSEKDLYGFFDSAKNYRDSLDVKGKGAIPGAFDFYVDLSDEAGQIAIIATILAARGISIKNIGIIHNREFEEGVLRISFYDEPSKTEAISTLQKHDYTLHVR